MSRFTELFYAALTTFNLGASHNFGIIRVFIDTKGLSKGNDFQVEIVRALMKAVVLTPIISSDALERMSLQKFEPNEVDNVLIEWMLALELLTNVRSESNRLKAIFPIMMGRTDDKNIGVVEVVDSLFEAGGALSQLSTQVASATIDKCVEILAILGVRSQDTISGSFGFVGKSPKDVVDRLKAYNGIDLGKGQSTNGSMVFDCASACVEVVLREYRSPVAQPVGVGGVSSSSQASSSPAARSNDISNMPSPGNLTMTAGVASLQAMSYNEVASLIRKDLKLDAELKPKDVIKEAAGALSREERLELANLESTKEKLDFIAKCLGLV